MATQKKGLGTVLSLLFLAAMFMGSGPGLRLINPDPEDPNALFTLWGLPKIYVWGLLWYAVQLAVILVAYFKIWASDTSENAGPTPPPDRGETSDA